MGILAGVLAVALTATTSCAQAQQPVVTFEQASIEILEGETVNAVFNFSAATTVTTTVRYTRGDQPREEIVVPVGETRGIIQISIVDNNTIEKTRVRFNLNLRRSENDAYYTLGSPNEIEVIIKEGVCDRTSSVRDFFIQRDSSASDCSEVNDIPDSLLNLRLQGHADVTSYKVLDFTNEDLRKINITNILEISGHPNLTTLEEGLFAGLGNLRQLRLQDNALTTLPENRPFADLGDLSILWLNDNDLNTLPEEVFFGLPGRFVGSLHLHDNPGVPFRLTSSLEPVDKTQELAKLLEGAGPVEVELKLREGAPYPVEFDVTASGARLSADSVTIPKGSTRSETITVTRFSGQISANSSVRVAFDTSSLPGDCDPANQIPVLKHEGQCITGIEIAGGETPNFIYDGMAPEVTAIQFTSNPQDPGNGYVEGDTINVDVVFDRVLIIPPIMEGGSSPTLALQIGANQRTARYVVESNADDGILSFVYRVELGDFDDNGISVVRDGLQLNGVSITEPVGDRVANVNVDNFLANFPEQKVRTALLISFQESEIESLERETIQADFNIQPPVPMGPDVIVRYTIEHDTADADDYLAGSGEIAVSGGATSGIIRILIVDDNIIEPLRETFRLSLDASNDYVLGSPNEIAVSIKEGVCDRTPQIAEEIRRLSGRSDCSDVDNIGGITRLSVVNKREELTALKRGDFLYLDRLVDLYLFDNRLTTLPEGVFDDIDTLRRLRLDINRLTTLPAGVFDALGRLEELRLNHNDLTTLPGGAFDNLGSVLRLTLNDNDLAALPEGAFTGLSSLRSLHLHNNPGTPFSLTLRLEPADETPNVNPERLTDLLLRAKEDNTPAMVKLRLREGAPYPLTLTLTASGVQLSADSVTIPAGSTQSETFTMTPDTDQIRIDFSEPPAPPNDCLSNWQHQGQCFTGFEIVHDRTGPRATTIRFTSTLQRREVYAVGEVIMVDVVFDEGLVISPIMGGSSPPTLALQIGANRRTATYVADSEVLAGILSFAYTVGMDDLDEDGINIAQDGLQLNGSTVTDVFNNPVRLRSTVTSSVELDAGLLAGFPEQKVDGNLLLVSFVEEESELNPEEGETASAVFNLSRGAAVPITVRYAPVPGTADADDYEAGSGEVVVPAGMTRGTIRIPIVDDDVIEHARDRFRLSLVDSDDYGLGSPNEIEVSIKEGICDRTSAVIQAMRVFSPVRRQGDCANVTNLNSVTTIVLQGHRVAAYKENDLTDASLNKLRLSILTISGHPNLTALPEGLISGNSRLESLLLYNNALAALPENLFAGTRAIRNLRLDGNDLAVLPRGMLSGFTHLRGLALTGNPGAPFGFASSIEPERGIQALADRLSANTGRFGETGARVRLRLREGAPYRVQLHLRAEGAKQYRSNPRIQVNRDITQTLSLGETQSDRFHIVRDRNARRVRLTVRSVNQFIPFANCILALRPNCFTGFEFAREPVLDLAFDGMAPQVTTIQFTSTPQDPENGYIGGEAITVEVVFDRGLAILPITEGSPSQPDASSLTLALQVGANQRDATYVTESNVYVKASNALIGRLGFVYVVRIGDLDEDGVSVVRDGLRLNGATLTEPVGDLPANLANLGDEFFADFPEQKVGALPFLSFEVSAIEPAEGETGNAVFNFSDTLGVETIVRYTLEPGTATADDYVAGSGEVVVPPGATGGTIRIPIVDDDDIERVRETFRLNLVASDGYVLAEDKASIEVRIREGVCDRTPQVAEAIRKRRGKSHCSEVDTPRRLEDDLSIVNNPGLTTLKKEDFYHFHWLERLFLNNNGLIALPGGVFFDLHRLERLYLNNNDLTTLPADVFDGLDNRNNLTQLRLNDNDLIMLPEGIFDGLGNLRELRLNNNDLTTLPEGVFDDLGRLEELRLNDNDLTTLPEGVFNALGNLRELRLNGNDLTTLPAGTFTGLSRLRSLHLHGNSDAPFRLAMDLEPVDETQELTSLLAANTPARVNLTLHEGAPYPLVLTLTASGVALSANSVTIPTGSTRSEMFTMTRDTSGNRVMVDFSEPTPPNNCPNDEKHQGQCFTGFEIAAAPTINFVYDAGRPQVTEIRFTSTPQDPDGYVEEEIIKVDVVFNRGLVISPITGGSSPPTLALQIGANRRTATYVVESNVAAGVMSFVYRVTTDDLDDNGASVAPNGLQLNDATVTEPVLGFSANVVLGPGLLADFPGQKVLGGFLPSVRFEESEIQLNEGTTVNAVFSFDGRVRRPTTVHYTIDPGTASTDDYVDVAGDGEVVVPAGASSGTIQIFIVDDDFVERVRDTFSLSLVDSDGYALGSPTRVEISIREGVCDRTPQISEAITRARGRNHCSNVDERVGNTRELSIVNNQGLTTLKTGDFFYLRLENLHLFNNRLTALPARVFGALGPTLRRLRLDSNRLTTLPEGIFDNLGRLEELWLRHNELTTLPEGIFDNLGSVLRLALNNNQLTALPEGAFTGLSSLRVLQLHDNPGAPFRLELGLEPADEAENLTSLLAPNTPPAMVKLTLREGAPYPLTLALTASGVQLSAASVTIPAGGTQSETFTMTPSMNQIRIDFSEPPPAPTNCLNNWKHEDQCFPGIEIVGAPTIYFVYDGGEPQATEIRFTSTPQDPDGYIGGETIRVDVVFDRGLVISPITGGLSPPTLALQIGADRRTATYVVESNVGAGVLSFVYTVGMDDLDEDGVSVVRDGLQLNGATVTEPVLGLHANVNVDNFLADSPGHKVSGDLLSVSFEETPLQPAEGETVNAVFNFNAAVAMPTTVHYTIEPGSANADDYEAGSGMVGVPAGMSSGTIRIPIVDDTFVERPRDTFSLNLVDSEGYALGSSARVEISIREGVCDRTPQVADAIRGGSHCSDVSDLSVITQLSIANTPSLTTLKGRDFFELDRLQRLELNNNGLTTLPAGVFDDLGRLRELLLNDNDLTALPAGVFARLQALRRLQFQNNRVATWPASIFNGLSNLQMIDLGSNGITQLPDDIFADNGNLQNLLLGGNQLRELPEQVFFRLPQLRNLSVNNNRLTELPAGAFPGYVFLGELRLSDNQLESLPPGLFSDLERANWVTFHNNRLTALPPGTFLGLTSNFRALSLGDNPGASFQLKLRLEFAGEEQAPALPAEPVILRATLREGAPYALEIELQAAHGTLSSTEVAIEAGSTRSGTFTVTHLQGENSVAVSFADVSPPPNRCFSFERRGGRCFSGLEIVSDAEFVLDDQALSAVSGVAITSAPLSGDTYTAGDPNEEIVVELEFSGEVDVIQANDGSWPSLALAVGDETRFAAYDDATSAPDKMVFRYKPQDDDDDDNGISVPVGALHLNGAHILDAGVPVSLSLGRHAIQNAQDHKVNVRNLRLAFDPAAVVLRAGGSPEVVALTLEGDRDDLLARGETLVVTLTPSPGLEVASESGKSLTMVTLEGSTGATTRVRISASRDAADAESLNAAAALASPLPNNVRVTETTLRVTVAQREIRVLFDPGRIRMVRGGAAADMVSRAVTMRTEPELQSGEALEVSLSADGVTLVSPTGPVRLTPANNAVTVTVEATRPLSALGAVSATLDEGASSFGDARVTTEALAVEVVRGVNLSLSGFAGQDSVRFAAGETTEVRVTTDPLLAGNERVTVTLSVDRRLSLVSAGSALIDGNVLVLSTLNPDATVAVATDTPNLDEANGVFASGAGENVGVISDASLRVRTDAVDEVTLVLSPPVIEVQQGGNALLRVTTLPELGTGQSAWVTLMIEPDDMGFSFVTNRAYFSRAESSATMTVLLNQSQSSLEIDVVSSPTAVIGKTAQVVPSPVFDDRGVTVNVDSLPRVMLQVTPPQVAFSFDPAPLALRLGTSETVELSFDDFTLRDSQTAELEVSVEGAGLSLQDGPSNLRVSLDENNQTADVTVSAAADAASVGHLVVRPRSGVELADGMETASLPIEAFQPVELRVDSDSVLIPRSRSTQFEVAISPSLIGDRQTTVTLEIPAQGFAQGFAFDGGQTQHEIRFDADNSTETVTVTTTAAPGPPVSVSVEVTPSSGVRTLKPPTLGLRATVPRAALDLTPDGGEPGDALVLNTNTGKAVTLSLPDLRLRGDHEAEFEVSVEGTGLILQNGTQNLRVSLDADDVTKEVRVSAAADAVSVGRLVVSPRSGVELADGAQAATLPIEVLQPVSLSFDPDEVVVSQGSPEQFDVVINPPLAANRQTTVTLTISDQHFAFSTALTRHEVTFNAGKSREAVTVVARTAIDETALVSVEVTPSSGVQVLAPLPSLTLQAMTPRAEVTFSPAAGLQLTSGGETSVELRIDGYRWISNQQIVLDVSASDGLTVNPPRVPLTEAMPRATVQVRASRSAESGNLVVSADSGAELVGGPQSLPVTVSPRELTVSFEPSAVTLIRGGVAADEDQMDVLLSVAPGLEGEEQLRLDLSLTSGDDNSLRFRPPLAVFNSEKRMETLTVIADSDAESAEVVVLEGPGTSIGNATISSMPLTVEVVRAVELSLSDHAGQAVRTLTLKAGDSTEITLATAPALERNEQVTVTLDVPAGLDVAGGNVLTLTATNPSIRFQVRALSAGRNEVSALSEGENVVVDGELPPLEFVAELAREVAVVLSSARVEVQRGSSAMLRVETDPLLGLGQTVTVRLRIEPTNAGLSFAGGSFNTTVDLGENRQSADVEVIAPLDAVIGSRARVIATAENVSQELEIKDDLPEATLEVTAPRVVLELTPDGGQPGEALVLDLGERKTVELNVITDFTLPQGQAAEFEVSVSGGGLSLQGGTPTLQVSLDAANVPADVTVVAAADADSTGELSVRASSGVGLAGGVQAVTLPIEVRQSVSLSFEPATVEIQRGSSAEFEVAINPSLIADRETMVTLTISDPGFAFGAGGTRHEVTFNADKSRETVTVAATAMPGEMTSVSVEVPPSSGVDLAPLPGLTLRVTKPQVMVRFVPSPLRLMEDERRSLTISLQADGQAYPSVPNQVVMLRVAVEGDDLTLSTDPNPSAAGHSAVDILLSTDSPTAMVTIIAGMPGEGALTVSSDSDDFELVGNRELQIRVRSPSDGTTLRIRVFLEGALE